MKPVHFTHHRARTHRRHFVDEQDVRVVLSRLPESLRYRLQHVHFNDRSRGRRVLGYVNMGHREIGLCAVPVRVSLATYLHRGQSPGEFGAPRGGQWPTLAVRRFLLYDVLLHELGHLQVVSTRSTDPRRMFAGETLAQRFADTWRQRLWAEPFDHPDPVHRPPSPAERAAMSSWAEAHREYKRGLGADRRDSDQPSAVARYIRAAVIYPRHAFALERLGVLSYAGLGTNQSSRSAVRFLRDALRQDPDLHDAQLFLAIALTDDERPEEARDAFRRAIQIDPYISIAGVQYGWALAQWGLLDEARIFFRRALRRNPNDVLALNEYAKALLGAAGSEGDETAIARARILAERAVKSDPRDATAHYCLARALSHSSGSRRHAVEHLRIALKLRPAFPAASKLLEEMMRLQRVEDGDGVT